MVKALLKNKRSLINRIRRLCKDKASVEVEPSRKTILFRGTKKEIEETKWITYHEMKSVGVDFLRLRDTINDKK